MSAFNPLAFGSAFDGGIESSDIRRFTRFNARKDNLVELKREFYNNGVLADPNAIIKVEIHKVEYDRNDPDNTLVETLTTGINQTSTGKYQLDFIVPESYEANFIYVDVWHYRTTATSEVTIDDSSTFRLFENNWYVEDGLQNFKYQLFPDIKTLTSGEKRNIELQIVPLPLYNTSEKVQLLWLNFT